MADLKKPRGGRERVGLSAPQHSVLANACRRYCNRHAVCFGHRATGWIRGCVRVGGRAFLAWTALGNAAVVGFGVAVVQSGYPATWCGWVAIVVGALILVQLLATGDALPASYHVAPALIGVALLLDDRRRTA